VILRPREKKSVFWRVKVVDNLQEKYVYTIPLGVYTVMNDSAHSTFKARDKAGEHSKVEVTRTMNTLAEEEDRIVSQNLEITCDADKNELYPGDTTQVTCRLRNVGTTPLKSVRVCLEEQQCKAIDIGIGQSRELSFTQGFTTAGAATLFIRASNAELSRSQPIAFVMKDVPAVNITQLHYPKKVRHGEPFSVVFSLDPVSHSTPRNLRVTVRTNVHASIFTMPELPSEQALEVELHSDHLSLGITPVTIEVTYEDDKGNEHRSSASGQIELTDVPLMSKVWLWFRGWFE